MLPAPIPDNEAERLASLRAMNLLSTAREGDLDRITRTAQKLFGTPIALISLIDEHRQWFKSRYGLEASETPRDVSFCGHAILGEDTFVVDDAASDPRFHDNPLVTGGPRLRFYAGQPLVNADGHRIGTLCVMGPQARRASPEEQEALRDLGRMVELIVENRSLGETQQALVDELETSRRDRRIDAVSGLWDRRAFDTLFEREIARAARQRAPLALALAAVDRLALIRETLGEQGEKDALRHVAEAFALSARTHDIVARCDENRFALVLYGAHAAALPAIGEKLLRALRSRAQLETPLGALPLAASIGLAASGTVGTDAARTARSLLATTERALEAAREAGGNGYRTGDSPGDDPRFALA